MINFIKKFRISHSFYVQQLINSKWTNISIEYKKLSDAIEFFTFICFDDDLDSETKSNLYYNTLRIIETRGNKFRIVY